MARCPVRAFGRLGIGVGSARELSTDGPPGPVEAVFRDSKIGEIGEIGQIHEGTDEIRKWITARYIFSREITG
ncbi:hypothetical protein [Streptomyces sp. NBC_00063]|uniref:hypothetical protein n=1 Tax=Streptomyces sp. NBC_00063 TaxID=2975638 RepID=UPI003D733EA3